jgi:phage baseplate assembly protein W
MQGIGLYDSDFPTIKKDKDLIMENVKRIILTLPGENVGNLDFGCRLREYIFDFENVLLEDIEQVVVSALNKWEPRIVIFSVDVRQDPEMREKMYVVIDMALRETFERFNTQIPIEF